MKAPMAFLFLLLLAVSVAADISNQFIDGQQATMRVNISSSIVLIREKEPSRISYAVVNLSFFPREDYRQSVSQFNATPKAEQGAELVYRWMNPKPGKLEYSITSEVTTQNEFRRISERIRFPAAETLPEYLIYTRPSPNINSDNPEIVFQASKLVEGEDDYLQAVHRIASWIEQNIQYDLSTLTAEISQNASWVLQNKVGVCDELTTLFIAMLRSLNIPSRFVSGLAYTDYGGKNDWGPHAWAEVYVPGYGWMEYDISYRQFGFVDLSHIKLKESLDSNEPSTKFEWKSENVGLNTSPLSFPVSLESVSGAAENPFLAEGSAVYENVNAGSYNLIDVAVTNRRGYYLSTVVSFAAPAEVAILGDARDYLLLAPYETRHATKIVQVNAKLDPSYTYTIPINGLVDSKAITINFTASTRGSAVTLADVEPVKAQKDRETTPDLSLACKADKEAYYVNETMILACEVKNTGNAFLEDVRICFKSSCNQVDLGITQQKNVQLTVLSEKAGKGVFPVTASNKAVSQVADVDLDIQEVPSFSIQNIAAPEEVSFQQNFELRFEVVPESSPGYAMNVEVDFAGGKQVWKLEQLDHTQGFVLQLAGSDLNQGRNSPGIRITYKDRNGKTYLLTGQAVVSLTNLSLLEKAQHFFLKAGRWFRG